MTDQASTPTSTTRAADDSSSDRGPRRIDAFFAPRETAGALQGADRVCLRAFPDQTATADGDFGPVPTDPIELDLTRGTSAAQIDGVASAITAVEIRTRALAWSFGRTSGSVLLRFGADPGARRFFVAETLADSAEDATRELDAFVRSLRELVGVPGENAEGSIDATASATKSSPSIEPRSARFVMRLEGDHVVLRDTESRGPKERVGIYRILALVCLALGVVAALVFVERLSSNAPKAALFGVGVVPVVLFVAAFAMNEIARHAARYSAKNAPLAWFANDGIVVQPWVSRHGAIDTKPEGRLGAAVACGEVHAVEVREREGAHAVTIDGLHGPIEVLVTTDIAAAEQVRRDVETVIAKVASPKRRVTALMRAATAREQTSR